MRCRTVQKLISLGLDGELDDARRAAAERHLRRCEACRRFAADLAALADRFDLPPTPEPAAGFVQRTLAALPAEAPPAHRFSAWREFFQPAPAALAAASLALGVFLALRMNGTSTQAEETDETVALVAEIFDAAPADSVSARYLELIEDTEQ
ncbi:MAG: zf-HC2 domain-containing protein [Planctomycetota bacterium]|nr:zf-HC2 domain-containing protein [Planctomycetota bacterium]